MKQDCVNKAAPVDDVWDHTCISEDAYSVWERAYWTLVDAMGGTPGKLAGVVGLSRQAPVKWREYGVPWQRALQFEDERGFPAYKANPIIYQPERILRWADQIRAERRRSASRGKR